MHRRRDGDDAIAHRDRRHDERDEGEQRRFVRADDAHHAPRLVHRQRDEARARRMDRAVEFVGEAGVEERAADRRLDLAPRPRAAAAPVIARRRRANSSARALKVLGEVIEHLRAIVRRRRAPGRRLGRRLDGVADVLAVAEAGQPDLAAGRIERRRSCSRSRAAPACRRYRAWRCGRCRSISAAGAKPGRRASSGRRLRRLGLRFGSSAMRYSYKPSRPPSRPKPLSR